MKNRMRPDHRWLFLFACSLFWLPTLSASDKPPNIVFFFADDQTSSALGCYGNPIAQTPTIDSLAKRGMRFDQALVSQSICWVSRTTILTGLTGRTYGTPGNHDVAKPESVEVLYSDLLRQAGYRTGFYGKWHAKMPKDFKNAEHFDEFEAIGRNPYYKKLPDGSLRHETDLIVDRGIEFLSTQDEDQPFALNLWFNACHAEDSDRRPGIGHFPWPRDIDGLYEDQAMASPRLNDPALFDQMPSFLQSTINRERYFWRWNTPEKYQTNVRAYYRMVTGIDRAMKRLLDALEAKGLADNTIIVYSADNGYYMGNRGFAGKWSHFEEALRVPLIIFDPRQQKKAEHVSNKIALNMDLPATFLDFAGVEVPEGYQGQSLKPLVEGEEVTSWRTDTFHEHFAVRHRIPAFEGMRNEELKYVRYVDHGGYEFLHDLKVDPDEKINFANDPGYKERLEMMRKRTDQRVAELGGPLKPLSKPFSESTEPVPVASANVGKKPDQNGWVNVLSGGIRGWSGDKDKYWSFSKGVLKGTADGTLKTNRFLTWKHSTIRNFEIQVEVRVSEKGNSGIQYRGKSRPDMDWDIVTGYQCDVVATVPKYNGMLYDEKGRRILAHHGEKVVIDPQGRSWIVDSLEQKSFPPGKWHRYRVLVEGNRHRHWIDDHMTTEVIDLDEKGRALEGVLAVQVHVGPPMTIEYRNFKLRNLPDDLPILTASDVEIPDGSIGVRPQGRLPKDWQPPVYKSTNE